jgi:hypothetical protein
LGTTLSILFANSNEKKLWMNGLTKEITILQLSIQEIKVMVLNQR